MFEASQVTHEQWMDIIKVTFKVGWWSVLIVVTSVAVVLKLKI